MCAAIRDASNLAWKLEAVLRHGVNDALLDTYQTERAPHVHAFIDLAVKLGDIIQTTDPEAARARDAKFKAGQPEIFQFPAPKLGAGVWVNDHALAGQIFPQPSLDDGHGIDHVLQTHFAVIGEPALLAQVKPETKALWQQHGVVVMPWTAPEVHAWFMQNKAAAVVLRPDRYILGVAHDAQGLERLSQHLPQHAQVTR
jgi:3-(3-hydroxy-phenyl)propionate hydroxylase